MQQPVLVVIGGGAAGFFCAINAAQMAPQLQVIIIEKSAHLLSKVKISGGGRCNVTHACFDIAALAKHYPRGEQFLKKAFHIFNTKDTIAWFEKRNIALKTEADGRMFPTTNTSQTIIDGLLQEAHKNKVNICTQTEITAIKFIDNIWLLTLKNGEQIKANFVCVATGGQPKNSMLNWLTANNIIKTEEPVPSLFTFNAECKNITQLMGISVPNALVKIKDTKLSNTGPLLITHWGFSGPAVLKLSSIGATILAQKQYNFEVVINWLNEPTPTVTQTLNNYRHIDGKQKIMAKSIFNIPNRLWQYFIQQTTITASTTWADITSKQINTLALLLTQNTYTIKGKTTYKDEFVTCGGISLQQIDPLTMQCKNYNNLFFAGEVLNIDGVTGGFNFQNAWTTGFIAAKAISSKSIT